MKKILGVAILVMFAATFSGCATTENKSDTKMDSAKPVATEQQSNLNVERSNVATTTAKVLAVDLKTRTVKLRSLEGKPFTIRVGKEAVNLPQVRVGDTVEVTYAQSLEVRMAEPGEIRADTKGVVGRAKPGSKPAAVGITETNITATIMEIDRAKETATLKMADGVVAAVKVQNPANLDKVKVGDTIAIKYIEAMEIKVKGKK
jgi:hypothetical protein